MCLVCPQAEPSRRAFKFAERVSNIYSGFKSRWHNHCTLETIFVETTVLFDIFVQYVLKYISKSPGHGCLLTTGPGKKVPSSLKPLQNRSPAHRRKSPRSCCHKLQHGDPIVTAGPTGLEMFAGPRRTLRILQNTHIKANIKAKINTSKKKNNMKKQMASFVFCIFFGVSWFVCFFFLLCALFCFFVPHVCLVVLTLFLFAFSWFAMCFSVFVLAAFRGRYCFHSVSAFDCSFVFVAFWIRVFGCCILYHFVVACFFYYHFFRFIILQNHQRYAEWLT